MQPNCFILYVADVARSAAFYEQLLGTPALEASPNFALFSLGGSNTLGLWARSDVDPPTPAAAGAMELGVGVGQDAEVDAAHQAWRQAGWPILQVPTRKDFGYTVCTADPDGHRVRVFRPAM